MVWSWTQWVCEKSMAAKSRRRNRTFAFHVEPLEHRRLLSSTVFTVTSAGDDPLGPAPAMVTLRDAINAVNADANDSLASPDIITFNIAGTPAISLAAGLTAIDKPVMIDGSAQAGVTVEGNGLAMLADNSTATINSVTFTGGTVSVGANDILTIGAASKLSVSGNLNAGNSATLYNYGSVSVSGSVVDAGSIDLFNGQESATAAAFTVSGAFTAGGDGSFVYNNGTSAFGVATDFTLGNDAYVYNGNSNTDAATFTVGGDLSIGAAGGFSYFYNYGASAVSVTGNFTLLAQALPCPMAHPRPLTPRRSR